MFTVLYNQARLLYRLEPVTGLLIKSGKESFDPTRPDMEFIRTWVEVGGQVREVPFLPGSSLKGVIRSHAERILRTLGLPCCDITREACVAGKEDKNPPYGQHCLACRTFGYTTLSSRMRFADAFPWKPDAGSADRDAGFGGIHTEQRPGVKIDRRLGTAAQGAFYEVEVITSGCFFGEITLRNYQLWQLGLLALVLRDINEGHQRVGAMKSRGLGRVKMTVEECRIEQLGALAKPDQAKIRGVGAVESLIASYDLVGKDVLDRLDGLRDSGDGLLRQVFVPDGIDAQTAWERIAEKVIGGEHWRLLLGKGGGR